MTEPKTRTARRLKSKEIAKRMAANPCGECSACCATLEVAEIEKPAGEPCKHLKKPGKCGVYTKRPEGCRAFFCAYRFGILDLGFRRDDARPDKLGIIFAVAGDAPPGVMLLDAEEVQAGAIEKRMKELHALARKGMVFRYLRNGTPFYLGAEELVKECQDFVRRRLPIVVPHGA